VRAAATLRERDLSHGDLPAPFEVHELREQRALGPIDLSAGEQQRPKTRFVEGAHEAEIDASLLRSVFQLVAGFRVLAFEEHPSDAREHERHLGDHAEQVVLALHVAKVSSVAPLSASAVGGVLEVLAHFLLHGAFDRAA